MSKRPFIKLFGANLSYDTSDMNWIERAIYINLLLTQWSKSNGMLSAKPRKLAQASGVPTRIWNQYGIDVVAEFFIASECGEFVYNERMYDDWVEVGEISDKRRKAGRAGGKATQEMRRSAHHPPQKSLGDAQTISAIEIDTPESTLSNDINEGVQANASNLPDDCRSTRVPVIFQSQSQKEERKTKNPQSSSSSVGLQKIDDDDEGGIWSDLDELEESANPEDVETIHDRIRDAVGPHSPGGFSDAMIDQHLIQPTEKHRDFWTEKKLVDLAKFCRDGSDVRRINSVRYLAKSAQTFIDRSRSQLEEIHDRPSKRTTGKHDWSEEGFAKAVERIEADEGTG